MKNILKREHDKDTTVIRIFVASPNDVARERTSLRDVANELNRSVCPPKGVRLDVVGWEEAVPDIGKHPQRVIDEQVGPYDIFIGIMWRRFGKSTLGAGSGTEHEFNLAFKNRKMFGTPKIMFYFKQKPYAPRSPEETNQWGKVLQFKKKLRKIGLIKEFKTTSLFKDLVREHLSRIVLEWESTNEKESEALRLYEDFVLSCKKQLNREISYLKGTARKKQDRISKKYLHDLYVERESVEKEFHRFLVKQKRQNLDRLRGSDKYKKMTKSEIEIEIREMEKICCVVVGEAGTGKTNLLCHLAEECGGTLPVLFYNSLYINDPLRSKIDEDVGRLTGDPRRTLSSTIDDLEDILIRNNAFVLVLIDAINESPRAKDLKIELANIVHENIGRRVKFYVTCRDIDWEFFRRNNGRFLNSLYSEKKESLETKGGLTEFTDVEFNRAWDMYRKRYRLKLPLDSRTGMRVFPEEVREVCKHPLMLRFLAEGFEGREIPKDIRKLEIFSRYWERKIEHTGAKNTAEEYVFSIVSEFKNGKAFGAKHRTDMLEREVSELLGVKSDDLDSVFTRILSENLITYLNWEGERVIGFTYEAFLEYAMARWIVYGREYGWHRKETDIILGEFEGMVGEVNDYRTLKGTTAYLIMLLEEIREDAHIEVLRRVFLENNKDLNRVAIDTVLSLLEPERTVPVLLVALKSKFKDIRASAADILGEIGNEEIVPNLMETVKDIDEDVRASSCRAIGNLRGTPAIPLLVNALEDDYIRVREFTSEALCRFGSEAIPYLIESVGDFDSRAREYFIEIVSRIRDERAIPALVNLSSDVDIQVRRSLLMALRNVDDERILPVLIDLLSDRDDEVRTLATEAFIGRSDQRALYPLIEALNDENAKVRWRAAKALGNLRDERAIPALSEAANDKDSRVERHSIASIERIGSESCARQKKRE